MNAKEQLSARQDVSLYEQTRLVLETLIKSGELAAGDRLPSERQLRERYGLSSTTVRRALLELQKAGLIYRRAGLGTFVAEQPVQAPRLLTLMVGFSPDDWRGKGGIVVGPLLGGILQAAWEHHATATMRYVPAGLLLRPLLATILEDGHYDGIILRVADEVDEADLAFLESHKFPYVVARRRLPGREMSCVVDDWQGGATTAVNHLIGLGHKRIGLILGPRHIYLHRAIETGYRRALEAAHIPFAPAIVHSGSDYSQRQGDEQTRALFSAPQRPDALLTATATMAVGAYTALREMELRIPDDVALVSWDVQGMFGDTLAPPLTAITVSFYDVGLESARLLLEMIEQKTLLLRTVVLKTPLIIRESCGYRRSAYRPLASGQLTQPVHLAD